MARLAQDWASGAERFAAEGEALLAAFIDDRLVAVGGLTREPAPAPEQTFRMRRLYVTISARRRGVAGSLVSALIQAAATARRLTVHAGSEEAAAFWIAQGFRPVEGEAWSHEQLRPFA